MAYKFIRYPMNIFFIIILYFSSMISLTSSMPVVTSRCPSKMLGNLLFTHCFGRIIAKELNIFYKSELVPGFPFTDFNNTFYDRQLSKQVIGEPVDKNPNFIKNIISKKYKRNVHVHGYFQQYQFYQPYKYIIKNNWLQIYEKIVPHKNINDVVIHVRLPKRVVDMKMLGISFDYYEKALSRVQYDNVYLCTDNPDHPFIENFKIYNPIIIRHQDPFNWEATLQDFKFIMSFNKIIMGQSTFSWWAAWLSQATEIYAPRPKKGFMCLNEAKNIDLTVWDEPRYIYIDCE